MARKRRRIWKSEAERAAHEARVDEHLRMLDELVERSFARSGETRPATSLEYLEQVMARHEPRTQAG
jgi:hypothetical protein